MNEYASFERVSVDMLEIRLKSGIRIDQDRIAGIMRERRRLCGTEIVCLLVLVPDDAELDIAVLGMDHYQANESSDGIRALAICSEALMLETMARLYAAYFPPVFRMEVFNKETDARTWLNEQVSLLRQAEQKA